MVEKMTKTDKGLMGENFRDSFTGNVKEQHGSSSNIHHLKGGQKENGMAR